MKNIILLLFILPMFCFGQYNRPKRYKPEGTTSPGAIITLAGVSFVTMGFSIRPLYYTDPTIKKPFLRQNHKAPPIIVGVGLTFTGLLTMLAEN